MNTVPFNPDNWLDFATIVIVALIAAVQSWLAARNHGTLKTIRGQTEEIKGQVVNGHSAAPPLRADLDRITEAFMRLESKMELLGESLSGLREDGTAEKRVRREEIRELREDVDARLNALHRRLADG